MWSLVMPILRAVTWIKVVIWSFWLCTIVVSVQMKPARCSWGCFTNSLVSWLFIHNLFQNLLNAAMHERLDLVSWNIDQICCTPLKRSKHLHDINSKVNISECQLLYNVSVLGREEGYTVKYTPLPEGVPEGEAQGNSWRQRGYIWSYILSWVLIRTVYHFNSHKAHNSRISLIDN